jgi:hypothetical protein
MSAAWATIIGAAVAAAASIIVSWLNNKKQIDLISYQIGELREAQEKHNKVIERTYRLEEITAVHEEKLKVAGHRIDDLEKKTGG